MELNANNLYDDANLARFYDRPDAQRADFVFCAAQVTPGSDVLDLGCGTGLFATSISDRCNVTGVEPGQGMLDIARNRANGTGVVWIKADARSVRLDQKFDLIILNGHSFQVFLTDADKSAVLNTIAAHLAPGGQFIFDSRNPASPARKTRCKAETLTTVNYPNIGDVEFWNQSTYDEARGILTYTNSYEVVSTGELHRADAQISYISKGYLADLIEDAGLVTKRWMGTWQGAPFELESPEIIPVGGLR